MTERQILEELVEEMGKEEMWLQRYQIEDLKVGRMWQNNDILRPCMEVKFRGIPYTSCIDFSEHLKEYRHYGKEDCFGTPDWDGLLFFTLKELEKCRLGVRMLEGKSPAELGRWVYPVLVSRERNRIGLRDCPCLEFQDLAVTLRLRTPSEDRKQRGFLIRKNLLAEWKVPEEDLFRMAMENMDRDYPAVISGLTQLIRQVLAEDGEKNAPPVPESGAFYAGNSARVYGAATVLDPKNLAYFYEFIGEDYYLIPSSIDEMILFPESKGKGREAEIRSLLYRVNREIPGRIVLSDSLYFYRHEEEKISEILP